jgi:hypothetical protein
MGLEQKIILKMATKYKIIKNKPIKEEIDGEIIFTYVAVLYEYDDVTQEKKDLYSYRDINSIYVDEWITSIIDENKTLTISIEYE